MKKVLLATTALALSAGVASADVSFSGSARMGMVYTGKIAGKAAVQGAYDTDTAAYINALNASTNGWVARAADDAVSAEDMAQLQANVVSKNTALKNAIDAAYSAAGVTGIASAADYAAAVDAATAAQDATALADLADLAAAVADATAVVTATENAADAAAAVAAASGTAAVADQASAWALNNRIRLNVDVSTETSSGLTFGGRLRIQSSNGAVASVNGARVYMKTGGLEIAAGNIYGAIDSMPGMYDSEVGLTALSDAGVVTNVADAARAWGFDGYTSTGSQAGVEAIYSAGGFTGHLSVTDSDAGSASDRVAFVGAYTMGDWTVALGMQDSKVNTEDKTVLTVGGKIGNMGVGIAAADNDGVQKIALNGSASFGATTVNGFVADDESGTDTAYGLGVAYDLGGASVVAGVERDAVGITRADMGVSFSF